MTEKQNKVLYKADSTPLNCARIIKNLGKFSEAELLQIENITPAVEQVLNKLLNNHKASILRRGRKKRNNVGEIARKMNKNDTYNLFIDCRLECQQPLSEKEYNEIRVISPEFISGNLEATKKAQILDRLYGISAVSTNIILLYLLNFIETESVRLKVEFSEIIARYDIQNVTTNRYVELRPVLHLITDYPRLVYMRRSFDLLIRKTQ